MKKLFFIVFIFLGYVNNAQTVIYETKLDKSLVNVDTYYLLDVNKILLTENYSMSRKKTLSKHFIIDSDKNSNEVLKDLQGYSLGLIGNNNVFITAHQEGSFGKLITKVYLNDNVYDLDDRNLSIYSNKNNLFNTVCKYNITDKKGVRVESIEKDEIYLAKINFITGKKDLIKLQKPDLLRLKSKELLKVGDIKFGQDSNFKDNIEIITKSITNDKNKTTLYRTIYDLSGKQIEDITYEIEIDNRTLVNYSNSISPRLAAKISETPNSNERGVSAGVMPPIEDIEINNYFIDRVKNEIYVFGALKTQKLQPFGFYVYKFSNDGKLIWKRIIDASDKEGFTRRNDWSRTSIVLDEYMNDDQLLFTVRGERKSMTDLYNYYYIIDKNTSNILENNNLNSEYTTSKGSLSLTGGTSFDRNIIGKNKFCNSSTLAANVLNKNVKSYIDKIKNVRQINIFSYITSKGIWLTETDFENYFKITLFK